MMARIITWSERPDSNRRPLQPQCSALANCATPRYHMRIISDEMLKICLDSTVKSSILIFYDIVPSWNIGGKA